MDELLDWTSNLNYEDYLSSWKQVGTSSLSELGVERRLYLSSDDSDNFGFNIDYTDPVNTVRSRENSAMSAAKSIALANVPNITGGTWSSVNSNVFIDNYTCISEQI